jgi:hypothetical protein
MAVEQPTKVVTGEVRFSYCHVWEASKIDPTDPSEAAKYSVAILIPKSDVSTLQRIQAAVGAAIEIGKSKLAGANGQVNTAALKLPLRDGDAEKPDDENYTGCYFFNATSRSQPGIVDAQVQPILSQSEFYSGVYGRVSVNFYAYNTKGNKGIAAGINNLQKTRDGEPLAGFSTPDEDFGPPSDGFVPMPTGGFDLLG